MLWELSGPRLTAPTEQASWVSAGDFLTSRGTVRIVMF